MDYLVQEQSLPMQAHWIKALLNVNSIPTDKASLMAKSNINGMNKWILFMVGD
jgi:hypothetical protein